MLLWCFAMADFFVSFFVFCVCRSLGVGGFRHVEIVVCCCGVLLWLIFLCLFRFLCVQVAGRGWFLACGNRRMLLCVFVYRIKFHVFV